VGRHGGTEGDMAYTGDNEERKRFLQVLGAEVRAIRQAAGYKCEYVASMLNETASRDRISKLERGVSGIDLMDYLRLMRFYGDLVPQHPAVDLARRLLPLSSGPSRRS
jgi:hypothetical protein